MISPQATELTQLLEQAGGKVVAVDGALTVTGLEAPRIGALATERRSSLHELAPRRASLEAAFIELTQGSLEYQATGASGASGAPDAEAIAATACALAGEQENRS